MKVLRGILVALAAAAFCFHVDCLPRIGDVSSPPNTHVSLHYIQEGAHDTGSPNLVTGVLADYRGFDTLGETSVMFVAGLTTLLILRQAGQSRENREEKEE